MPVPAETHVARSPRGLWREIGRDAIVLGAATSAVVVLQLVYRGIAVSAIPASEYGRLAITISGAGALMLVGACGIPNAIAREVALSRPSGESANALLAALAAVLPPVAIATAGVGVLVGWVLGPGSELVYGMVGLPTVVLSLVLAGALRGAGRVCSAALVPVTNAGFQVLAFGIFIQVLGASTATAWAAYNIGNAGAAMVATMIVLRGAVPRFEIRRSAWGDVARHARHMLGFGALLAASGATIAAFPFVVRAGASLESYTLVAALDVALLLYAVPQRFGTVLVQSVVPAASSFASTGRPVPLPGRSDHLVMCAAAVILASLVGLVPWLKDWLIELGGASYEDAAELCAVVILATPARVMYAVVAGFLIARGEARFLAGNAAAVIGTASAVTLLLANSAGGMGIAMIFALGNWLLYLSARRRLSKGGSVRIDLIGGALRSRITRSRRQHS